MTMLRRIGMFLMVIGVVAACSSADDSTFNESDTGVIQVAPSQLNAGEIDDNAAWGRYLDYRTAFLTHNARRVRDIDVSARHTFTVTDASGLPVSGARVMVYAGQTLLVEARTDAAGQARFYPSAWTTTANEYEIIVQQGQAAYTFMLSPQARNDAWHVALDDAPSTDETLQLDVLFLLDATGSMADEIGELQTNILRISERINDFAGTVDVQYGLVAYRDRGDEYVTRAYDFVDDVTAFQANLDQVEAYGGGDVPESLNEGLHVAVRGSSWRDTAAIKLVFLVADAPPHLNYADDYDYSFETIAAAWQGIKIHPIASSGLPPDGEFIFRQIAQYTGGHFIFLTYDGGVPGSPGEERPDLDAARGGNFSVSQLDDLVIALIEDDLAAIGAPVDAPGASVQLTRTEPVGANAMPIMFALDRPAPQPPTAATNRTSFSPGDPYLIFLLAGMMLFGVILILNSHQQRNRKRKRKNEMLR